LLVEMLTLVIHCLVSIDFVPWRVITFASDCGSL